MQHPVNISEVSAPVAPKVAKQPRREVCIGVDAWCNSRRKTYFAECSQQSRSFYHSHWIFLWL